MSTNAERFGQIVKARRDDLDLNQLEVSAAGGPSNSLLTEIENGRLEQLTRQTARKLDKGLRWEPGSARETWNGGDPTVIQHRPDPRVRAEVEDILAMLERAGVSKTKKDAIRDILDSETG